jgi:methyltransferase family protein
MTNWQERISTGTDPSIRAEHILRYVVAAPIVGSAATWCDLGCGTGLAAGWATPGPFAGTLVLVDVDEPSVAQAAAHLQATTTVPLTCDLDDAGGRAAVRAAVVDGPAPRAITCFEVLEHVHDLAGVVELLIELATEHETTVVISVPNDAFWAIENPYHATTWSSAAFGELRALLPADHVFAEQIPLRGSRVRVAGGGDHEPVDVAPHEGAVASHFLAAFGPAAPQLRAAARVFEADQRSERSWINERESHLAYTEVRLESERASLRALTAEMDDWRRYIHELEDRLGVPRAGSKAAMANERRDA